MTEKARDKRGRWRCVTIGFRVSPEENKEINQMVSLSGLSKQEYIVRKLTDKTVEVIGSSPRVFKGLKGLLQEIYEKLCNLQDCTTPDEELQETIRIVAGVIGEIRGEGTNICNKTHV